MKTFKLISIFFILFFLSTGCQTVKKKTDSIIEKENKKMTKYIGKTSKELISDFGKPKEDFKNEKGNLELIYKNKKFGITCERKFEIDTNSIIIGFTSNGCF